MESLLITRVLQGHMTCEIPHLVNLEDDQYVEVY